MTETDRPTRSNTTPWRLAVEQILSDGQWHRREDIVAEVSLVIPREVALRFRRRLVVQSEAKRRRRGREFRPNHLKRRDVEEEVQIGRRAIVNNVLHNLNTKQRRTEVDNDTDQIRLLPKGQ